MQPLILMIIITTLKLNVKTETCTNAYQFRNDSTSICKGPQKHNNYKTLMIDPKFPNIGSLIRTGLSNALI